MTCVADRIYPAGCGRELLAIEAGDALVALEQACELGLADHVVDVAERLVAGALVDLLQDRVGRIAAVGQHHLRGRRQAALLVGLERRDRIGDALEAIARARRSRGSPARRRWRRAAASDARRRRAA